MYAQPGKKLLFMGGEFGQWREWNHDAQPRLAPARARAAPRGPALGPRPQHLLPRHPALHERDSDPRGFEWIDCNDADASTLSFLRMGNNPDEAVLFVFNFTPVPRDGYRIGVPCGGRWDEVLNSDAAIYGGSGLGNVGGVNADAVPQHGRPCSLSITAPPLAMVAFRGVRPA